jgi:hypothetical protein
MQINAEICQKIGQSSHNKTCSGGFLTKAYTPCFCTIISTSFHFLLLDFLALKIEPVGAFPDPTPKLQDSKCINPAKCQMHFRPSGKYAASTHFRIPFNFTHLLGTPDRIYAQK